MVHVSQRIADYIGRHRLSYVLSTRFDGMSCRKYIKCCIVIAVMVCTAYWATPFTISKGEGIVLKPADMAELGAGIESVYYNQFLTIPRTFIIEHLPEGVKTYLGDCPAQFTVSDHVADSEVFENDHVILSDQSYCQFVEIILAGVGDRFMYPGNLDTLSVPSYTAFLSSGKDPLFLSQLIQLNRKESGIFYYLSGRETRKTFYPEVNAYRFTGLGQELNIFIEAEGNKVFPGRFLDYRSRCGITLEVSAPSNFQLTESGDSEAFIDAVPFECAFRIFGRLPSSFLFEPGVLPGFTEEIIESGLQMPKGLLGRDTGYFIEPYGFGVTFPACEHGTCLPVGDGFFLVGPCVGFNMKSPVIHIAAASEDSFEVICLVHGRVESEDIPDFHAYNILYGYMVVNYLKEGKGNSSHV